MNFHRIEWIRICLTYPQSFPSRKLYPDYQSHRCKCRNLLLLLAWSSVWLRVAMVAKQAILVCQHCYWWTTVITLSMAGIGSLWCAWASIEASEIHATGSSSSDSASVHQQLWALQVLEEVLSVCNDRTCRGYSVIVLTVSAWPRAPSLTWWEPCTRLVARTRSKLVLSTLVFCSAFRYFVAQQ